jgi:tetratricopeptide (TPR) repeat protein
VSRRWVWLEKIPFLLLGAAAVALAFMAEHEAGAIVEQERDVIGGLGQAMFRLAFYLWKTLVPAGLSPVYAVVGDAVPATWGIAPSERAILWLSAVIVLGLSAALFFLRRRWPAGLTCGVCYAALLLPVLGVVQVGAQIVADRYSYLPCLGLAMLAGGGAAYGWRTPRRRAVVAAIGGALILFVVSSWRQAEVWHDSERLWRHALKVGRDSARAHYNLALSLSEQGKPDEEMEHYRDALRVNPQYAQAQNNLGNMLFRRGQQEEGMALLRAALKSDPLLAEAHYGLGNMHYRRGELDEAAGHYREAVRIRPGYADAHINLALLLANQGKEPEAIEHLRRALEIDPSDARVHYNLAGMLAGQGNLDEAVAHLNQALGAEPNVAMIHETLARVLERQGKREEAIEHYREAMRLMK